MHGVQVKCTGNRSQRDGVINSSQRDGGINSSQRDGGINRSQRDGGIKKYIKVALTMPYLRIDRAKDS